MSYFIKMIKPNDNYKTLVEKYNYLKSLDETIVINENTDGEYLFANAEDNGEFISVVVTRDDFISEGFKEDEVMALPKSIMNRMAAKIGENMACYGNYWESLVYQGEINKLTRE